MTGVPDSSTRGRTLRDYRLLLSAFVVSTAGDWLYKLALPVVVLNLTGSALQTAVVYSLEYLPYLLFAPASTLDLKKMVFNTEAHPIRKAW